MGHLKTFGIACAAWIAMTYLLTPVAAQPKFMQPKAPTTP
jgi:hypothetical protein